jgi:1,2-dihydroxy-3-keto-5-methylthiopentene dioxygenase
MAVLSIPDEKREIRQWSAIESFLRARGVRFEKWTAAAPLSESASPDEVMEAYAADIARLKKEEGYQTCDVISVNENTPNLDQVRQKFLPEHTHSEDEVRYFVDGSGIFWFHMSDAPVFAVTCEKGDFLSVPANTTHWFDFGPTVNVKCIRLFNDPSGWVANYTGSGIDKKYNPVYGEPVGTSAGA